MAACSVEKNTPATRFYHGMTAKYNIYFNGYESFLAGVQKVNNAYADDYAEILRVFEFSDPATPGICKSDMDRAVQKASKLISLKSITALPEENEKRSSSLPETDILERREYNEWVDDSYLLIGISRFYKHEFNEATSVFNYSIKTANDPDIRKEAAIWLARILNEKNDFSSAYRILAELEIEAKDPGHLRSKYYTTFADHYIKQKKYSEAVEYLTPAVDLVAGKRTRYRLTYLLAQLHQVSGNASQAMALYRKVIKMNPPYDVEFNARINIAGVFDVNSGNPEDIRKELRKMLKDSKNKDYNDQIYYALGNLAMKEGRENEAIGFYRQSASSSTTNRNQKGRSFLALADYYYSKPDFMNAGLYYDSTVTFLNQKHPDYQAIRTKSSNINSVVTQLIIIEEQDSLQMVAAMPENERNKLISEIINEIVTAESEGKRSEYASRYSLGQYYENERRFQGNIEQEGKWYFYNQAALTFGRTEFRRRWGDRPLEDNWRRSNKAMSAAGQTAENAETAAAGTDSSGVADYRKPDFYLKNLPMSDSLLKISNEKIAGAYLNAGKAYHEKLSDDDRATEILEKLLTRYPSNPLIPEALYTLYNINRENNNLRAETYRQRLVERYPDTEFALILSDPEYFARRMAAARMAEEIYMQAYNEYENENFSASVSLCDTALARYPGSQLVPKFRLLRAYNIARTADERAFRAELAEITKSWPGTEESKQAASIIDFLNKEIPELKVEEEKQIAQELYLVDTVSAHAFIIIIENPKFNINQAVFDVISYNIDNYTNINYRTQGELVENKYIMISVTGFARFEQSMDYYNAFAVDRIVRNPSLSKIYSFIISTPNLRSLNSDRNPERYLLFFRENYLNEKNQDTLDR